MSTKIEGVRPRAMKARDAGKYIGVGRGDHIVPIADLDAFVDAQAAAARAARSEAPAFQSEAKTRVAAPPVAPSVGAATHPPETNLLTGAPATRESRDVG